jgi:hypothetical protein
MSPRRREQLCEHVADPAVGGGEAAGGLFDEICGVEAAEPERFGLAVERLRLRLEQLPHQSGFGAGEDVGGAAALVLDVRAQHRFQMLNLGHVLELVEDDQRSPLAAVGEAERQVEQRVQRGQRIELAVDLQLDGNAVGAEREPEPGGGEEAVGELAQLSLQLRCVGALDPDGDVGQREDP